MRRKDEKVGGLQKRVFLLFAHRAERHDVVAIGERHPPRSGKDEGARAAGVVVLDPVRDELVDRLALTHLPHVEDERAARRVAVPEGLGVVPRRRIETESEDLARDVLVREARMHEVALLRREEAERARQLKERAVRKETQRLFVVGRGDERGTLGDERETGRGRFVDIRVKEDRVVPAALAMEELEKRGSVRALLDEPPALLGERVRLEEQVTLGVLERRAPKSGDWKAADTHRAVHRLARQEMRRPGPVIERGRRGDLYLVQLRQALRDDARV